MLNLILDSAKGFATAIVADDGRLQSAQIARGSTLSLLHELASRALGDIGLTARSVDLVTAISGPGSWTGLHVCMTAAKTIAQVVDVPLLGISMLECLAASALLGDGLVCATIDAKHGAYYSCLYEVHADGIRAVSGSRKRNIEELAEEIKGAESDVLFVGDITDEHAAQAGQMADVKTMSLPHAYPAPEAFVATSSRHRQEAVSGDARFAMTPEYMQEDFTITPWMEKK